MLYLVPNENKEASIYGFVPDAAYVEATELPPRPKEKDGHCLQICADIDTGDVWWWYKPLVVPVTETLDDLKRRSQEANNAALAEYLAAHPMQFIDGKYYGVTMQDQLELTLNLSQYELAAKAGYPATLEWHSIGEQCTAWTLEDYTALTLAIAGYVYPFVRKCQEYKASILGAATQDELSGMRFTYGEGRT